MSGTAMATHRASGQGVQFAKAIEIDPPACSACASHIMVWHNIGGATFIHDLEAPINLPATRLARAAPACLSWHQV